MHQFYNLIFTEFALQLTVAFGIVLRTLKVVMTVLNVLVCYLATFILFRSILSNALARLSRDISQLLLWLFPRSSIHWNTVVWFSLICKLYFTAMDFDQNELYYYLNLRDNMSCNFCGCNHFIFQEFTNIFFFNKILASKLPVTSTNGSKFDILWQHFVDLFINLVKSFWSSE